MAVTQGADRDPRARRQRSQNGRVAADIACIPGRIERRPPGARDLVLVGEHLVRGKNRSWDQHGVSATQDLLDPQRG
jgi:hypothetical protein